MRAPITGGIHSFDDQGTSSIEVENRIFRMLTGTAALEQPESHILSSPRLAALGPRARLPVVLLSFLSGLIGLGYQVMWFRLYADRLGSSGLTFLLVLVAFIGGLGLGSFLSEGLAVVLARIPALRHPLALVGAIELAIAGAALLTLVFHPSAAAFGGSYPFRLDARDIYVPTMTLRL